MLMKQVIYHQVNKGAAGKGGLIIYMELQKISKPCAARFFGIFGDVGEKSVFFYHS